MKTSETLVLTSKAGSGRRSNTPRVPAYSKLWTTYI